LPIEAAFRLFTEGIATWWPLKTHSVGEEQAKDCTFEGQVGGRIYESFDDGTQVEWGRVLAWNPPVSVVFTWYPGRTDDTAQKVEVMFKSVAGGTQLELVHTGWELLGERAPSLREGYDTGWDYVLNKYREQAGM
jgi:hypothetical protein